MISIVICSRTTDIDPVLAENIRQTIGTAYEIIVIDNSQLQYSIFEAYNLGVSKSTGEVICFMHDDIFYHTQNWGNLVQAYFEDLNTGAIGIAGSPYVTKMPGTWWGSGLVNQQLLGIKNGENKLLTKTVNGQHTDKNEVVVLDGVWICIKKCLFEKIRFDDVQFKGFHSYDIDICLQINKLGYKIYVVFDVLIAHLSSGKVNESWIENEHILYRKWLKSYPITTFKLTHFEKITAEYKTLNEYILILLANNVAKRKAYKHAIVLIIKSFRMLFFYKTPYYLFSYIKKGFLTKSI